MLAGGAYVYAWNLAVNYGLFASPIQGSNGQITVTTTLLTTSTDTIHSTTTMFNETYTATMCPAGVTSCTGESDYAAVVVDHPLILFNNPFSNTPVRFADIPVYDSSLSPPYLTIYHNTYFAALTVILTTWAALAILDTRRREQWAKKRKMKMQITERKRVK